MLLKNGKRCRYMAKAGSLCGIHLQRSSAKQRAIRRLIQAGKLAGAVTALIEFIRKAGPLLVKVTPTLARWLADGATVLHGRIAFCLPSDLGEDGTQTRLVETARYMKQSGDYATFPELADAVFKVVLGRTATERKS